MSLRLNERGIPQLEAKNVMLFEKANKWEGKEIDKEEKLSKAMSKLNENIRQFEVLVDT